MNSLAASALAPWSTQGRLLAYLQAHTGKAVHKRTARRQTGLTCGEFTNALIVLSYADCRLTEDDAGNLLYLEE